MFQKMSDEEVERRARDANERRQKIVRGEQNTNQSNPLHPDTASEFGERYGGSLYQEDNYNPARVGPTNTKVEKKAYTGSRQKRKKVGILRSGQEVGENQNQSLLQNTNNSSLPNSKKKNAGKLKAITKKALDIYGSTVGRGLIATAYLWTNFIYLTFQIWLGIIAVIAIGLVFAIEYFVGDGVTRLVFNKMMAAIGVDWDFYLVAFLCYLMVVTVCYIQLFGVAIQAKALGLHPLGGKGSFFKTGTFLLCFVLYWVPIVNCLPLVNLYILSIEVAPR